jgi:hypothetical protein
MATRNLTIEKNAVDTFVKQKGKLPSTPSDWGSVHKMAYPTMSDLPDELKDATTLSYYGATGSPASPATPAVTPISGNPLSQTPEGSQVNSLGQQKEQAYGRVMELGSGNEALRVLQEAIKTKTGVAKAPIGESEIFKSAGVGGIGALSASLATRGEEILTNAANFQNALSTMSGQYKDMAQTALFAYQEKAKEYDTEIARLQKIEDDTRNFEQQIDLLQKQHANAIELEKLKASTPSVSERITGWQGGFTFDASGNPIADVSQASADDVANAIAQVESGGRFGVSGASGESGAFQFMPATWKIISQQYLQSTGETGDNQMFPNILSMTQENENKVARWKIGQLLAAGNTPEQVAMIWNGSLGGSEQAVAKKGVNSKGVKYDTQAYADKVTGALGRKMSGSGSAAESTALAIFNGTSTMKLTDLPVKQRDEVNKALVVLKNQALQSGDIMGVIRASAGGSKVDATAVTSFEKAVVVINQLEGLKENIKNEAIGPIVGIIRKNNPYDTKAQLIKAQLVTIVPGLARGVYGEVGVLTDNDIANYSKTLPNLKNTKDITDAVLAMTVKSVSNSLESKIKIQAGLGRDVSGLGQVYSDVKAKADELLGSSNLGGEITSGTTSSGLSYTITP